MRLTSAIYLLHALPHMLSDTALAHTLPGNLLHRCLPEATTLAVLFHVMLQGRRLRRLRLPAQVRFHQCKGLSSLAWKWRRGTGEECKGQGVERSRARNRRGRGEGSLSGQGMNGLGRARIRWDTGMMWLWRERGAGLAGMPRLPAALK